MQTSREDIELKKATQQLDEKTNLQSSIKDCEGSSRVLVTIWGLERTTLVRQLSSKQQLPTTALPQHRKFIMFYLEAAL
ncbi:hypothetical protein Q3G72_026063 [Acer saccharum]|nr:hypothetical protein Q3G72_026063 [Acer saccharum]